MSFDIVRGIITKPTQTNQLIEEIAKYMNNAVDEGTLYLGYPLTANSEEKVTLDALLVSQKRGMVIFTFQNHGTSAENIEDEQDKLYYHLDFFLKKYASLRKGRRAIVDPIVITVLIDDVEEKNTDYYKYVKSENIPNLLDGLSDFNSSNYRALCEALQKITNIRTTKNRPNANTENSKGWIIKQLEKEFANLDEWQKKAAFEMPEGPQRIRGLAGTGKTIVLALKTAYLYTEHPEWKILVTFYTRSLYQQYIDLITKFVNEFKGENPDFDRINIWHAWGGKNGEGVYSSISYKCNTQIHTLSSAISKFGRDNPFKGMCDELLPYAEMNDNMEEFDAVLIDEAQDLPASFFRLLYLSCRNPKRIIWAYDELQNLSNLEMPSLEEMFGTDQDGHSLINIDNHENEPRRDIILPICYRNPPWTLALAHSLGFGLYSDSLPVQIFDNPKTWQDIGYSVISGKLQGSRRVKIERRKSDNPEYFYNLLSKDDSVVYQKFPSLEKQYVWVANEIYKNITEDELDPDDILVIFPDAYSSKSDYQKFAACLKRKGINSFLAGVNSSQDEFRLPNSVTCSGIFRAKGNEAPMVYILNSEYCAYGAEPVKLRNILFTAITRSRAWVRIYGVGDEFSPLASEIKKCISNDFVLAFKCPTKKELEQIRRLNRERTDEEKANEERAKTNIDELLRLLEDGSIDKDSPSLRALFNMMKKYE